VTVGWMLARGSKERILWPGWWHRTHAEPNFAT